MDIKTRILSLQKEINRIAQMHAHDSRVLLSQQLSFRQDTNKRGEEVDMQYMTKADEISNTAENSSAKSIEWIAVSKGQSIKKMIDAYALGIRDFGESYLQEAEKKQRLLPMQDIHWHFIGNIQSNKATSIAKSFQWVHSLSSAKIARLLNAERSEMLPALNICIQVNHEKEASKGGVSPTDVPELAILITTLPHLRLRGLMFIPPYYETFEQQCITFQRARALFDTLNASHHLNMDTLSMGMSHDFHAAIKEGSTLLRLGEVVFGSRE